MLIYNKAIFNRCFNYKKRYWYKNIAQIPLYFKLLHELVKYGYDEYATWETFRWFTITMRSILERYKDGHNGVPILMDNDPFYTGVNDEEGKKIIDESEKMWDDVINRMIELLKLMDEECPKYDSAEYKGTDGYGKQNNEMNAAKNEFFKLFSEHFWKLWD